MSIVQDFGNSWDNLTVSYNNTDILCEVKGTLRKKNFDIYFNSLI